MKLTALSLPRLEVNKRHFDGNGLYLVKGSDPKKGRWQFRFKINKRSREMGLGPWPDVSLREARDKVVDARRLIRDGTDPIEARKRNVSVPTLSEAVNLAFEVRRPTLKGKAWKPAYNLHIHPALGLVPVTEVTQNDLHRALSPLWRTKHQTALKCIQAIRAGLSHAKAQGFNVDLTILDAVRVLLGDSGRVVKHFAAMPWQEVPEFYATLGAHNATRRLLSMLILTGGAARTKPLRFMTFDQVRGNVWTIPAEVMKGRTGQTSEFRIPLSNAAMCLLNQCRLAEAGNLVFTNTRGTPLTDNATGKFMRDLGSPYKPHGFRASFRGWMAAHKVPFEVAETAIAHKVGSRVTGSYLDWEFLDERRQIMEDWAYHVTSKVACDGFSTLKAI